MNDMTSSSASAAASASAPTENRAQAAPSRAAANDTSKIARKREREARTVSQMISLYCKGHHEESARTHAGHCGEMMCEECKALDDYAVTRTMRCRRMEKKISCELCGNHCYARDAREKIRAVMRYAGPRMLKAHPIAAIRHLAGKIGAGARRR